MENEMNNEDYKQCVENMTNENSQELLEKMISSEMAALKSSSLEELHYIAAKAIACLKLSDNLVNILASHHANCAINYINESSLSNQRKESMTPKIIKTLRVEIAEIRTDRNKDVARCGGKGKVKKDTDGKQKAKIEVKEWWNKWQQDPSLYESQAAFALAMLDKYDGILKSVKVIERWCTEWTKSKQQKIHST